MASTRKTSTRGGYRPGAGRKPVLKEPVRLSVVLEQNTVDALASQADDDRISLVGYIRRVLEQHVARKRRRSR